MKFNLKAFLLDLAEIGPSLLAGIFNLKNEASHATKTQLATDSLTLATGVATALTSANADEQADAQAASAIAQNVINVVAAAHTPTTPATPGNVGTVIAAATPTS